MSDPIETDDIKPPSPLKLKLRKLFFTLALLGIAWVAMAQVGATFFFQQAPKIVPTENPIPKHEDTISVAPVEDASPKTESDMALLVARIETLETKIKALEEAQFVLANNPAESTDNEKLSLLDETVASQNTALQTLNEKLTMLEHSSSHHISALMVFIQLKTTFDMGAAYVLPLATLKNIFADDEKKLAMLAPLSSYAEKGAPTLAGLQKQFSQQLLGVDYASAGNSLSRWLQSVVRIRKIGEQQTGSDDESIIARAEAKLQAGKVDGALTELASLSAQAAAIMAPWVASAKDFLTMQKAISEMELSLSSPSPKPASGE